MRKKFLPSTIAENASVENAKARHHLLLFVALFIVVAFEPTYYFDHPRLSIVGSLHDGAWPRHVSSKCSKNDGGSMEE